MAKPKAPKSPDLVGLDAAQAERNKTAAYDVMNQNRYSQVTPTGRNDWVTDPTTGKVTNTTSYSPEQQALYDKNNALAQKMSGGGGGIYDSFMSRYYNNGISGASSGGGGGGGGGYSAGYSDAEATGGAPQQGGFGPVGQGIQNDLDYSKLTAMPGDTMGERQKVQDALYARSTGYLDPQYQESQRSLETQLSNKGLVPGTPAFNNAMQVLNQAKEKAYAGARNDAITGSGAEQERLQNMILQLRNQGVTEAGNLGAFHNAAQNQGAQQYLTQRGQDKSAGAALAAARASASSANSRAQMENDLATRAQSFNEMMAMGKFGQGSQMLPQFGTSQGNLQGYGTGNAVGAANNQYQNDLSRYNSSKGGMLPGIGSFLGQIPMGGLSGSGGFLGTLGDLAVMGMGA